MDKIDDESGSDNIKIKVKLSLEDRGRTYNTNTIIYSTPGSRFINKKTLEVGE